MTERHVAGRRLSAFLDDELPEHAARVVTRHLAGCEVCRDELGSLRTARDALRSLPHLQAPVLTAGLDRRSIRSRSSRLLRAALAVLAVPIIVLGAAYALGEEAGVVEPPAELFLVEHLSRTGGGPVPAPVSGR